MTVYNLDPIPAVKEIVYSKGRWVNPWRWAVLRIWWWCEGWMGWSLGVGATVILGIVVHMGFGGLLLRWFWNWDG
ncbi:hypothetical protein C1H46_030996 [Malus baccata]|uniref:Uncharacterized protein n=1 Tax=Malus baccata TaxID=106549 RepID=A0A540LAG7_MALBA|nr:hypothetical protein C1H46_030996 [Malus baccata]